MHSRHWGTQGHLDIQGTWTLRHLDNEGTLHSRAVRRLRKLLKAEPGVNAIKGINSE